MNRYAARIGSVVAGVFALALLTNVSASAAQRTSYVFQGRPYTFSRTVSGPGGIAIAIDDPALSKLLDRLGATVTWQPGQRYVLLTTAEPVVVSFAMGDPRYDVGPIVQSAPFAPFSQNGVAYVSLSALMHSLDLAPVRDGSQTVLEPELAALDVRTAGAGIKVTAHAGIPLDARLVSETGDRVVVAFDGVGSMLPASRAVPNAALRSIDVRSEGTPANPTTIVTFVLAPGAATHPALSTDDQRDATIAFGGESGGTSAAVGAVAPAADAAPSSEPIAAAEPAPSPSPAEQSALVDSVQTQTRGSDFIVHVGVSGDATYAWHRLRPPDNRWWIDIRDARLSVPPIAQPGNGDVSSVRSHQDSPHDVRIALSLSAFDVVNVTPDATGVTITVSAAPADVATADRSGGGSIGSVAAAYASPAAPQKWKFSPRPAVAPYAAGNGRLIVIDPGHGGSDFGAVRGSNIEKVFNLEISKRLRRILIARGWDVVMTRTTDRDVYQPNDSAADELQARDNVANQRGARLFISIHTNAFINAGPHGATTYYYKPSDFALAQAVERRIAAEGGIAADGVVKDKLYVIHHAVMPATLVETAFISNPDDVTLLNSPAWQQKMAKAIADGIGDYAGTPPPASEVSSQ